jgi:uncharacterized protein YecE (DUF72 family)
MAGKIRIGIGGWNFEPWRGVFYPKGLRQADELNYAASKLGSIEINSTYRGAQKPESFAKWRDATPDDFVFSLKGPMFATNKKVLAEAGFSVDKFIAGGIAELGPKLGPINWQFMATKKFDPEDFEGFLKLLPPDVDGLPLKHAVEVRSETFLSPDFVTLARRYGVGNIIAQHPKYPQLADITADFVYVRLQTSSAEHPLGYSDEELDRVAEMAKAWAKGKAPADHLAYADNPAIGESTSRDVFIYMIAGEKVLNPAAAMALMERVS